MSHEQPVHKNSAISLATLKLATNSPFVGTKSIFLWTKREKSTSEHAIGGFVHDLPCRVKEMALRPHKRQNLGLLVRLLSTESLGPCFSYGMGNLDRILHSLMVFRKIICYKYMVFRKIKCYKNSNNIQIALITVNCNCVLKLTPNLATIYSGDTTQVKPPGHIVLI